MTEWDLAYVRRRVQPTATTLLAQALDALEEATAYTSSPSWSPSMTEECTAVAAAIRAVLAAQPAPVPLTADDIWLLWTRACEKPQLTRGLVCDFARAVEAHHGIAASPEVP
jgi:hypothetical protein